MTSASSPTSEIHESQSSETSASSISVADRVAAVETEASTVTGQSIAAPIDTSGSSTSPTNQAAAGQVEGSAVTDLGIVPSVPVGNTESKVPTIKVFADVMSFTIQKIRESKSRNVHKHGLVLGVWTKDTLPDGPTFYEATGALRDAPKTIGEQIDWVNPKSGMAKICFPDSEGIYVSRPALWKEVQDYTYRYLSQEFERNSVGPRIELGTQEEWKSVCSSLLARERKAFSSRGEDDPHPIPPRDDGYLIGFFDHPFDDDDWPANESLRLWHAEATVPSEKAGVGHIGLYEMGDFVN